MIAYQQRIRSVQTRLEAHDVDVAIFGAGPNLQYLTGADIDWRRFTDLDNPVTSIFVPAHGQPVLLTGPFAGVADDLPCDVRDLGLFDEPDPVVTSLLSEMAETPGQIAIGPYTDSRVVLAVSKTDSRADLSDATGLLDDLRMRKTPDELERLRDVAALTDTVMEEVISNVSEGDTMAEITLEIERVGRKHGASDISFPPTAGFYAAERGESDQLFNYDADEGLESGTSIAFDVGFVQSGYCSDWGRSVFVGDPPEHIREAYSVLMRAVTETIDAIGDEIHKTNEIFPYIETVCDREGYGEYLRNRHPNGIVGHQIGVEVHENPWLTPENDDDLVDGMVFCIEPKLWNNGEYYLRVEDMVSITDGSAESLTNYDREQFVL